MSDLSNSAAHADTQETPVEETPVTGAKKIEQSSRQLSHVMIAHLSDPHLPIKTPPGVQQLLNKRVLGYLNWQSKRRHHHQSRLLRLITDDIALQAPDQILISGDLVNLGLPSEFDDAAQWLESLGSSARVMIVPGNHDTYVKAPWDETLGKLGGYLTGTTREPLDTAPVQDAAIFPSVRETGPVRIIGVNCAPSTPPFMATGAIDSEQLKRLKAILSKPQEAIQCTILMLHHPLIKGVVASHKALRGLDEVLDELSDADIDLVLHGHAHIPCLNSLTLGGADARQRSIPHIGVASASYAGKKNEAARNGYRPAAQYHLYKISQNEGGLTVSLEIRGVDLNTQSVKSMAEYQLYQHGEYTAQF